jgi:hypothetical protein
VEKAVLSAHAPTIAVETESVLLEVAHAILDLMALIVLNVFAHSIAVAMVSVGGIWIVFAMKDGMDMTALQNYVRTIALPMDIALMAFAIVLLAGGVGIVPQFLVRTIAMRKAFALRTENASARLSGEEMIALSPLASTIAPDMAIASITEKIRGDVIAMRVSWETIVR